MIKNNPIFSYIDSDFENWNVVDKYPHVEKREINIKTLEKDSTFAQIFDKPEEQWVTQEELIDFCENRKDEMSKDWYNFFLLKSEDEFFVADVFFDDDGRLKVYVNRLSYGCVWDASYQRRFVVPATKPVILSPETLKPSGTLTSTQHKVKETYEFIHNDISVFVRIDYFNNKIDILECTDRTNSKFKKKEFVFIGRGVEYMKGWRNILEAISEATKDAQAKYEKNLAEESRFKENIIN